MTARNEVRDMLAGPKIGRTWVACDSQSIREIRWMVSHLQTYLAREIEMAHMECLKDALRELSDHIDDGRAALDQLPDIIDEEWQDERRSA